MSLSDQQYSFVASQMLLAASRVNVMQGGETRPGDRMPEHVDKLLLTLNWLTFCLVMDSEQQSVAAALHRTSQGFTIILSTNVPVTSIQQTYAMDLVASINNSDYPQCSNEGAARNILALIVRYAWKRIHRKATLIVESYNPFAEPEESTMDTLKRLIQSHPDEGNLLSSYKDIISLTPSLLDTDPEVRFETFLQLMDHSSTIMASPLLAYLRRNSKPDTNFALRFYRRVQRLHFYIYGAEKLSSPSYRALMPQLHALQWLPLFSSVDIKFPTSSTEYATDVLRKYGFKPSLDDLKKTFFPFNAGEVWRAGESQTLYVHPEAQLADYLLKHKITPLGSAIGCSKRACRACAQCVFQTWTLGPMDRTFSITMPSEKVEVDWLCPNVEEPMYLNGMEAMRNIVGNFWLKRAYEHYVLGISYDSD